MFIPLAIVCAAILALMGLKLVRTVQELTASRAGYITFGGDDRYQARNVHLDVHDAVMIARVRVEMTEDAFEAVIRRIEQNYLRWHASLSASIPPALYGNGFDTPLEIWNEYRKYELTATPILTKIVVCRKEQVILLVGNHIYLGGYLLSQFVQLVFCQSISKNVFPRNRYVPVATELSILALFGRLAFRRRHIKSLLYDDQAHIQRFYLKQDLASIREKAAELQMHHLHLVIAMHVFMVMKRLNKTRLRVTLPVSFSANDSFNTVGAIFLDVDAEPDVEAMARKIRRLVRRNQWQVSASNHIQRIFPTRKLSARARNMVDLTLTVVPQKTLPNNLLANEMKDYEFTMDNIHYPVYVMAFIFEDHVHSSFMINTPEYDVDAFMAQDRAARMDLTLVRVASGVSR